MLCTPREPDQVRVPLHAGMAARLLRLPQITGYLVSGIICGPYVLGILSRESVLDLNIIEGACLSIIGLAAGAELDWPSLSRARKQVGCNAGALCDEHACAQGLFGGQDRVRAFGQEGGVGYTGMLHAQCGGLRAQGLGEWWHPLTFWRKQHGMDDRHACRGRHRAGDGTRIHA